MRIRTRIRFLAVLAATLATLAFHAAAPALSQTPQDIQKILKDLGWTQGDFKEMVEKLGLDWCLGVGFASWEQQINTCTSAIKSGKYAGRPLASLFYERAGAYYGRSDYEHAIQDYDEAVRINANLAIAFYERGFAKRASGDTAGGSADITRAGQLQPNIGRSASTADKTASDFTCQVRGGPFVLTDADFKVLGTGGMTREKFMLLPPTSKARLTVCDSRKLVRVLNGKHDGCVLDRYPYLAAGYLDKAEREKVLTAQIDQAASEMAGERPKCQ